MHHRFTNRLDVGTFICRKLKLVPFIILGSKQFNKNVLKKTEAINSNVLFTVYFKLPDLFIILIIHLPAKQ